MAPSLLIRQAIRDTIRDFCRVTRAYQVEVENEAIQEDVRDYQIVLPADNVYPIAIESLSVDGVPSEFKTLGWLDTNVTNWRERDNDDFTGFTHLVNQNTITFPGYPTKDWPNLRYRISLRNTDTADGIAEEFVDQWKSEIEDGAKAKLLLMVNKSWTNVQRGGMCELQYRAARGKAKIRVSRSFGNAPERWVGPKFAR